MTWARKGSGVEQAGGRPCCCWTRDEFGFSAFSSFFPSGGSSQSPTARENVKSKSGIPEKSSKLCIANIPTRATALVLAEVAHPPGLAQIAQGTQMVVTDEVEGVIEALVLILRHPVNNLDTRPRETLNILKTRISATRHVMISLNLHILRMGTAKIKVRTVEQHLLLSMSQELPASW